MLEILVYLYESYRMAELAPDRNTLEKKLFAAGFDEPSVKEALDWFGRMAASEAHPRLAQGTHFRHYAREELERLDDDCCASLRFLEEAQILDAESREWVINGLMNLGGEDIGPEQVRWMSLIVLWSRGYIEHFTFLEELLLNEATLH
jgi:Smg protein